MVGGCVHGALQLSFIEIRATGFNLPHFWQNTALMVAETLLSPFQGTKQYECRGCVSNGYVRGHRWLLGALVVHPS